MKISEIKKTKDLSRIDTNNIIKIKPVTRSDYLFLYQLLKVRDPRANISHKSLPTYKEHINFVKSKPYSVWYIIFFKNKKVGSVYLTKQNEIGIFLKKEIHGKGIGSAALKLLIKSNPRSRYLANISPRNTKSTRFFMNHGFKLIQYTYEMIPNMVSNFRHGKKN